MEIALTWDLVLVALFVILFVYNFLLGQNATVKLILSIYIAALTADALAGILKTFVFDLSPGFEKLFGTHEQGVYVVVRLGVFLASVVAFVLKSSFHVRLERHDHWAVRGAIHSGFSALSATLFLSTLLIYLSGNSFVEGMLYAREIQIYEESVVAQILIDYYQFWFSLPAVAFLVTSFLFEEKPKET